MPRVLIIDDSAVERKIIAKVMTTLGYSILEANDGEEGEEKAKSAKPDIIVLDVVMPKKDGYQVCRNLKKMPETANIPVIMITSKNQESDKFWGLKQGAIAYIVKPFNEQDLVAAVTQAMA
ncbi:response regulator receiver protein [Chloroherpeton thalassium ATCC 35110]|uniref:Response regulator receiver protein n=1 Tax=Chloroherpeton thalassium (strain ATCC 35110 / GB-78) TaxID=517418 RepID=B3QXJ1_CHLT3|nr:response regulator [Chloroherpeton thalassium]ACF14906.1 response regulator receiver protein [Chloroherpeton thalassium ATCC 35110]